MHSTPDGERRSLRGRVIGAGLRTMNFALRVSGLRPVVARPALDIALSRLDLAFPGLPPELDGYVLLHIADPHFDGLPGLTERILALTAGLEVDLLVLTGDYRYRGHGPFVETGVIDELYRVAAAVRARDGTLATLGNHDRHEMVDPIERSGIRVLINEAVALRRGGAVLHIAGTDDVNHCFTPRALEALATLPRTARHFGIALVHSPELAQEAAAAGYALYLSGHTHGGQICLRPGRPLIRHLHRNREFVTGLWRCGPMQGYTSTGAGISGVPVRINCRGEIALIRLCRATPDPAESWSGGLPR